MNRKLEHRLFFLLSTLCCIASTEGILLQRYDHKLSADGNPQTPVKLGYNAASAAPPQNPFNVQEKIVYLDLKMSPPKIAFYREFFPYLRQLGATGVLIEYDRMFPYTGFLKAIRGERAYSEDDIKQLVRIAADSQLEVIPLIQTFGHMQYLLEQKEFFDLREIISKPDFICPSANRTQEVLRTMMDQILALHEGVKWVHIGCDQVYQLGKCTRCNRVKQKNKIDNNKLFLNHVKSLSQYLSHMHELSVLMWDDMLQAIPKETILEMEIQKSITPLLWKFDKTMAKNKTFWGNYLRTFPKVWVATSFKDLSDTTTRSEHDMKSHLDNHASWGDIIKNFSGEVQFAAIVISGWQNYNHFSQLTNLIATSIPSLTLDLFYVNNGGLVSERLFDEVTKFLKCNQPLSLDWKLGKGGVQCKFPGSKIFSAVEQYEIFKSKLETTEGKAEFLKNELEKVQNTIVDAFKDVFFNETLEKWQKLYLNPMKTILAQKPKINQSKASFVGEGDDDNDDGQVE